MNTNLLAIATYATKNYLYAMSDQLPLLVAAIRYAGDRAGDMVYIFVSDGSDEAKEVFKEFGSSLTPMGIKCTHLTVKCEQDNENKNHAKDSNLLIARMQGVAFAKARELGAERLWSLESDILPNANTLLCLLDTLQFDRGLYDVAMATYPNDGFLGGRGTPSHSICPDVYEDERELTDEVKKRIEIKRAREKDLKEANKQFTEDDLKEWRALDEKIKECPQKGNIWALNAKGYRLRGWFTNAYPGVGFGAIVPVEWVGMGCTLLSRSALELASFVGYDGQGTQDLFLCWRCWHPARLNIATTSHAICSHVKMRTDDKGEKKAVLLHARHELSGEMSGHLRVEAKEFHSIKSPK